MLSSILVRLGGLVAIVGGTASATLGLLYVLYARGLTLDLTEKGLQKGHYENPALTMLLFGVLAAIVGLHVTQRRHYGMWGALGSVATFAGVAMIVGGTLLGVLGPAMASTAMLSLLIGILAVSVGIAVLGIVTMIAGRLPRWCGAAVIAGSPPFVFLAFMIVNFVEMRLSSLGLPSEVPGGIGWGMLWVLAGVPWALVGYAIFRAGPQQPSRVQ
jgi:hypothetical protein